MSKYGLTIVVNENQNGDVNRLLKSISSGLSRVIQVILVGESVYSEVSDDFKNIDLYKIDSESTSLADIYCDVKDIIEGEYVSFSQTDVVYQKNAVNKVLNNLQKNDNAVCIHPIFVDVTGMMKEYPICPPSGGTFNVINDCSNMNMFFKAYFFKRTVIDELGFNNDIITEQDKDFLIRYILKYRVIKYFDTISLKYYAASEDDYSTSLIQYRKEWYLEDIEGYIYDLANKSNTLKLEEKTFVRACLTYLLFCRFSANFNDRNKKIIQNEDYDRFESAVKNVLSNIPDEFIFQKISIGDYKIIRSIRFLLVRIKYGEDGYRFKCDGNNLFVVPRNEKDNLVGQMVGFLKIENEIAEIMAMNYAEGNIQIDVKVNAADYFRHEDIDFCVKSNSKVVPAEKVECYPLIKCFGRTIIRRFQLKVSIPVGDFVNGNQVIGFYLRINDVEYLITPSLKTAASRITERFRKAYWRFDNYIMSIRNKRELVIKPAGKGKVFVAESQFLLNLLYSGIVKRHLRDSLKFIYLRISYRIAKAFHGKKRIWVSFDKLYKGGDNGEYMYHYLKENCKDIKPYYIINKDAPDYKRLKKEGANLLVTNTMKCRRVCLLAETILATHSTIWSYCGFESKYRAFAKDLFSAKLVCIQHGLTVQKIAQYQNRLFDNTLFYCCASKYEVENILQPIYGYKSEDVVLTGLARYDGLKNNDQKQILITPTWRRDIVNNGIAFIKKSHNNHFKDSAYFKVYNNLINDSRLIETAKEYGYRIIYLLHPAMSSQAEDFDRNDYVELMEAAGDMSYEKILTESSLMVTDYSGVQFDFAYQRKPVVYYHPEVLPPSYEEGVYRYDKNGFGEICTKHDELIDTLCDYIRNECKIKPFYNDRANDFFAYDDFNSCERIYNEVKKYLARFN